MKQRLDAGPCAELFMPGTDPQTGPVSLATGIANVLITGVRETFVREEPPLNCYGTASCRP